MALLPYVLINYLFGTKGTDLINNKIIFSCNLKVTHDLNGMRPLGFEVSEYCLLLHGLKGSNFVVIYITNGVNCKIYPPTTLRREKSIKLVSISWPEKSCKAIVKNDEKIE